MKGYTPTNFTNIHRATSALRSRSFKQGLIEQNVTDENCVKSTAKNKSKSNSFYRFQTCTLLNAVFARSSFDVFQKTEVYRYKDSGLSFRDL